MRIRGLRLQNDCVGSFSISCLLGIYRDARVDREANCGKHVWLILNCLRNVYPESGSADIFQRFQ